MKVRMNHLKVKMDCLRFFKSTPSLWAFYRDDATAQREYWLNYTDDLRRAGLISQHNRDHWSCPF